MTSYYRHAWMIPFAIGAFSLLTSIPPLLFGIDPDPARIEAILGEEMNEVEPAVLDLVKFLMRTYGLVNLAWSLMITVVAATAYRRGEKWAWYAMWSLPAYFIAATAILLSVGLTTLEKFLVPLLLIVSVSGLLMGAPRRSTP